MNKPVRLATRILLPGFVGLFLPLAACATNDDGDGVDCESPQIVYPDTDGDGYGDDSESKPSCDPSGPPAGFTAAGGDCDDTEAAVSPVGKEVCDGLDNNCDGRMDDADPSIDMRTTDRFYLDSDGDGFGDPDETVSVRTCAPPAGYVATWTDCDDSRASVNPNAKEICDHLDNDCDGKYDMTDGSLDMTTARSFYRDADFDTVGTGTAMLACDQPSGYVATSGDCNDGDNLVKPGGVEICDGADNDCDGGIDGTAALPNRCTGFVGTYTGSYSHLTQEKVGSTVVNSMSCTGSGNAAFALNRRPGIQGTFTCTYSGGLTLFSSNQRVVLKANVGLDGTVTGTAEHEYSGTSLKRTYNVTGTQTATGLNMTGTGSWYPSSFSTVPWQVNFTFTTTK